MSEQDRFPLLSLPNEVLLEISTHLHHFADQNALIQTNRRLHHLLNESLWSAQIVPPGIANSNTLWWGIKTRSEAIVSALLKRGIPQQVAPVRCADLRSFAVRSSSVPIVRMLLDARDSAPRRQKPTYWPDGPWDNFPLLGAAIGGGNEEMLRFLVERGEDPTGKEYGRKPPLYEAAYHGQPGMVRFLVECGCEVDGGGGGGGAGNDTQTPLTAAVEEGSMEIVRFLLSVGADPNALRMDSDGPSMPLLSAIKAGEIEIVRVLFDAGARLDLLPDLDYVFVAVFGNRKLLELLLEHTDDESKGPGGKHQVAIFVAAASCGLRSIVEQALVNGLDPNGGVYAANHRRVHGAFVVCAEYDQPEIAELLLHHGADLSRDSMGNEALHEAANRGYDRVVRLLLDSGESPMLTDNEDQGIYGDFLHHPAVFHMLVDAGAPVGAQTVSEAIQAAITEGNTGLIQMVLDRGGDVVIPNRSDRGFGVYITSGTSIVGKDLLEFLERQGVHPVADSVDGGLFVQKVRDGHTELVQHYLKHGIDPYTRASSGQENLVQGAIRKSDTHLEDPERLVKSLDIILDYCNLPQRELDKLLAFAAEYGPPEVVKSLLARGAEPVRGYGEGLSPLELAVRDPVLPAEMKIRYLFEAIDARGAPEEELRQTVARAAARAREDEEEEVEVALDRCYQRHRYPVPA